MITTLALATPPTPPKDTASALRLHQAVGPDLGCEAARDLRHGVQQREPARRELNGLVGDAGDLAPEQLLGQRLVGGEVEVGEEGQALVHPVVLLGDGLLHLEHHVGVVPDLVGAVQDLRAGRLVLAVVDLRPDPGAPLDVHVVAVGRELVHADRGDGDAVLVVLDFLGDADLHRALSSCMGPVSGGATAPDNSHL
jgi:hypothetical protein